MKLLVPILFALGTALCWGMYGPTLSNARSVAKPPSPDFWSPFKPYVFIGVAYLVIAVVGGLIAMKIKGDTFSFSGSHSPAMTWGFFAGCLGGGRCSLSYECCRRQQRQHGTCHANRIWRSGQCERDLCMDSVAEEPGCTHQSGVVGGNGPCCGRRYSGRQTHASRGTCKAECTNCRNRD